MDLKFERAPYDFMERLNAALWDQRHPSRLTILAASGNFDWTTDPEEVKENFETVRRAFRLGSLTVPRADQPWGMTKLVTLADSSGDQQFRYYGNEDNPNPPSAGTVNRWRNLAAGVRIEANSPAVVVVHVPTGVMGVVSGNPKYLVHGTVGQTITLMERVANYPFDPADLWVVPSPKVSRPSSRTFRNLWKMAGVPAKQICSTPWDTQLNEPGLFAAAIY